MSSRRVAISRRLVALATTAIVVAGLGGLAGAAGGVLGANTRLVYFGAPADVCPATFASGCGGGIDANGTPTTGTLIFSPALISTSTATSRFTAYRLAIANTGGQTLSHVVVLGGSLAGLTTNPLFPPPTTSSLPSGFSYYAVGTASGPAPACTVTASAFRCSFGNLGANSPQTVLTVILVAPATIAGDPLPVVPWNELQLNEGSSTSGANVDSFYALGTTDATFGLRVTNATQDSAQSFILPAGLTLATDDGFATTRTNPTTTRIVVPGTANGDDAAIAESDIPTTTVGCASNLPKLTCFLQQSVVSVLLPTNLTTTGATPDTFSASAPLRLDFRWNAAALISGVTPKKLQITHDGVAITTFCSSDPPGPTEALPCRLPTVKFDNGDLGITVYSDTNGSWKPGV